MSISQAPLAVLVSGGLDSAVLVGLALNDRPAVYPIYIRSGLAWESAERDFLSRFLNALRCSKLQSMITLELPVTDLYGKHWSLTGRDVPDNDSPDDEVYLPGRNVLLLSKAMIWCRLHDVAAVALATLAGNPFPDATPEFFQSFERVVNQAIDGKVRVETPFAGLNKAEVIRRGRELPLELTLSCLQPTHGRHCGRCNKCAERRRAFVAAAVMDPTNYHS